MDAPIFPTERESETEFRAPDLMILDADHVITGAVDTPPAPLPAVLKAGHEYLVERLSSLGSWAWRERQEGDGADWRLVGIVKDLPPYIPATEPQRIVKNKVAWHMIDDGYRDEPSGRCDP